MVKIGDKIKIVSDNENYDRFRNKVWIVNHIATNTKEHIGYVYHYKTKQYEELNNDHYGYKTYYCLDWIKVVEVETKNPFN